MTQAVKAGFQDEALTLPLAKILPTKQLTADDRATPRYQTIAASVREVGVVEPLVVYPERGAGGTYLLLDGHARRQVLLDLGVETAVCLVSTDDEGFTYNHRINRLAPIQEHRMIMKALEAGVSEERIAKTLNLEVETIKRSRSMLQGICAEAVEILKDKPVAAMALRMFKRVKPMRQIEMAELMVAVRSFSGSYAKALLAATPRAQLLEAEAARRTAAANPEDLAKMEHEMQALERDVRVLDDSYGRNVVNLTLARAYLKSLLENAKVVRFLAQKHPDLLAAFQKLVEATALET